MVTGGLGVREPRVEQTCLIPLTFTEQWALLREGKMVSIWPPDLSLPLSQAIPTSPFGLFSRHTLLFLRHAVTLLTANSLMVGTQSFS